MQKASHGIRVTLTANGISRERTQRSQRCLCALCVLSRLMGFRAVGLFPTARTVRQKLARWAPATTVENWPAAGRCRAVRHSTYGSHLPDSPCWTAGWRAATNWMPPGLRPTAGPRRGESGCRRSGRPGEGRRRHGGRVCRNRRAGRRPARKSGRNRGKGPPLPDDLGWLPATAELNWSLTVCPRFFATSWPWPV